MVSRFIETIDVNVVTFDECGDSYRNISGVDRRLDSPNGPMEWVLREIGDEKRGPPNSAKSQRFRCVVRAGNNSRWSPSLTPCMGQSQFPPCS